ncbi:MAG: hypothetical protein RL033_2644 [Pseudomonadota bacterium]
MNGQASQEAHGARQSTHAKGGSAVHQYLVTAAGHGTVVGHSADGATGLEVERAAMGYFACITIR